MNNKYQWGCLYIFMALITKVYAASSEEALIQNLEKPSAKNQTQFMALVQPLYLVVKIKM